MTRRSNRWRVALAPLVLVAVVPPVDDQAVGSTAGPAVQVRPERARPGERIDLSVSGFISPWVTASVCGNNALRGSADCNMAASEGNELDPDEVVNRFTMPVPVPPVDCPCVIRVVGANQAELALAPIEVVGHPVGPLVEAPSLEGQVDAAVTAGEEPAGLVAAAVASLGGDTRYEVEVSVRNRSAETLSAVVARGTAIDPDGSAIVTFDLGAAPPIAPGQTWTTSAFVVLPAPVVGTTTWRVDVVGAGPPLSASTSTRHRPTLLIVLLCAAVLSLAALVGRRLVHRHAARSELAESQADDAAPSDHAAPSGEAAFRPAEFREHSPV